VAYSASLGGMSTLTGTGPNIILHGVLQVECWWLWRWELCWWLSCVGSPSKYVT
jgi:hypothetical protein